MYPVVSTQPSPILTHHQQLLLHMNFVLMTIAKVVVSTPNTAVILAIPLKNSLVETVMIIIVKVKVNI